MPRELSQEPRAIRRRANAAAKARGEVVKLGRPVGSKTGARGVKGTAPTPPSIEFAEVSPGPPPPESPRGDARGAQASEVHSRGAVRRLRALVSIGYLPGEIANHLGTKSDLIWMLAFSPPTSLSQRGVDEIARVYRSLASKPRPLDGSAGGPQVESARLLAAAQGWASPAGWDDIDADPEPIRSTRHGSRPPSSPPPVDGAPSGEGTRATASTAASRVAAMRAQLAAAESMAARRVAAAEAEAVRLEGALVEARQSGRSKDDALSKLQGQLDDALIRIRGLETDRGLATRSAEDDGELRRLREEVAVRRLVGSEVTCALGGVVITGTLDAVDDECATAQVAVAGELAREFPLSAWSLEPA